MTRQHARFAAERDARRPGSAGRACGALLSALVGPLLGLLLSTGSLAGAAEAEAGAQDLTELSIEELSELDVFETDSLSAHLHLPGEWVVAYQLDLAGLSGLREGRDAVTTDEAHARGFANVPLEMENEVHSLEVMYTPRADLTLVATLPYVRRRMRQELLFRDNGRSDPEIRRRYPLESEGIGDVRMGALYSLLGSLESRHHLILEPALSFPTGSIDKADDYVAFFCEIGGDSSSPDEGTNCSEVAALRKLPYAMQLGSGSLNLLPAARYVGRTDDWSWMLRAEANLPIENNANGYRPGNRYSFVAGGSRRITDWLALSTRADMQIWGNVHGADPDLAEGTDGRPSELAADPHRQGGKRLDIVFGVNLYAPFGLLKGTRISIEGGLPLFQSLEGPQLETDWRIGILWQWAFFL